MFRKILAIDDSDVVLKFHRFTLRHLIDAELLTAKDGVEGFKILKENPDVDLILLDINMPLLYGVSFLRMLRSEAKPFCGVSVVVISTESDPVDLEDAFAAGADAYVKKPFERGDLLKVIEALDKKRRS